MYNMLKLIKNIIDNDIFKRVKMKVIYLLAVGHCYSILAFLASMELCLQSKGLQSMVLEETQISYPLSTQ